MAQTHKHTALYHVVTRARQPFAKSVITNGVLPRGEVRRAEKASSDDYLAALSNVQRNAAHRMPHNTVVKSFPYSSSLVSLSDGWRRRIRRRKRRNPENVLDVFHALVRVHMEKRLALSGIYVVWTFSLPALFVTFRPCRMLALLFHCIMGYKQPPPSLHRQHYRAVWYTQCTCHIMQKLALITSGEFCSECLVM